MKRMLWVAVAIVLAMTACTKKEQFTFTASNVPAELNNSYVYVYDATDNLIDSVLVTEGKFVYTVEAQPNTIGSFEMNGTRVPVVFEKGDYTLDFQTDANGKVKQVIGGPAESALVKVQAMNDEITAVAQPIIAEIQAVYAEITEAPTEEQQEKIREIQERYISQVNGIAYKYYAGNEDNFVGYKAFGQIQFEDDAEYIAKYEAAGDLIKNDESFKKRYDTLKAAETTQVGMQFVDFEMDNTEGVTKKLSEYKEEGKYFLLDFFASWCGPCKRSMPILAEIEKEYAARLTSISVATWDELEDYKKAVEDLEITWHHFFDSENNGAAAYGVSGVPTFILFSPEGEILVRTHNPEDIRTKLAELK